MPAAPFEASRFIAAGLVCADYKNRFSGKTDQKVFLNIDFILLEKRSILLTGIGGLGKTELVKKLLHRIMNRKTVDCGIRYVAWVPHTYQNLAQSCKAAFHLHDETEQAWMYIQNLAAKHGDKMLLIIDNVEKREGDRYLKRLNDLPCCVLVTSRYKEVSALSVYELGTLEKTECRQLFYHFYKLGRNDECLDEIIELASRHTIMVEFLAKVVQLEGMKLGNLLDRLIEKEFKLSGEDVSGNHERLQTENTIIRQMCILFSMVEVKSTKTFEAIDSTAALVVKAVHAAFTPLEKWVLQREYNLEETKKLLEEKLRGVSPEKISTPPPYIAVPALQSIAYCMDDPVLREMYAELLATAMNSETVGNVHPTYVEIIRQMSPYDALVFRELCKQVVIPCMDVVYKNKKTGQSYPISEYVVFTDLEAHPLVQTQISLENLKRLCIIDVVKNKKYAAEERYTELKSAIRNTVNEFVEMNKEILKKNEYTVEYQEYVIMIRGFGQFFARACLGTDFSDIM